MGNQVRKQVASIIAGRCPHGGRLTEPLTSKEIAELLSEGEGQEKVEESAVEEALLEMAAVGFIWLSIVSKGRKQKLAVCAVFYPYGLELIA